MLYMLMRYFNPCAKPHTQKVTQEFFWHNIIVVLQKERERESQCENLKTIGSVFVSMRRDTLPVIMSSLNFQCRLPKLTQAFVSMSVKTFNCFFCALARFEIFFTFSRLKVHTAYLPFALMCDLNLFFCFFKLNFIAIKHIQKKESEREHCCQTFSLSSSSSSFSFF